MVKRIIMAQWVFDRILNHDVFKVTEIHQTKEDRKIIVLSPDGHNKPNKVFQGGMGGG